MSIISSILKLPIQAILHLFGGAQHCPRLVFGFLPFHFKDRVGHDAGRGLHVQHAVLDHAGADRDRHVHFAAKRQVAAGAAIDAALGDFQFVDHFHCAHFRRAGQGAGREGGAQHVEVRQAVLQRAFHVRDDMLHMRVFFDHHAVGDLHAASRRDAADIVARQVDQHHVFGDLFRVGQQFGRQCRVAFWRGAARTGAGDRTQRHFLAAVRRAFIAHQNLGRSADDLHVAEVIEVHVRRRVQRTQRAVQRQRRIDIRFADALADLHLHQVAGHHVFMRPGDRLQVVFLRKIADRFGAHRAAGDGRIDAAAQHHAQVFQALARLGKRLWRGGVGVDDQIELAGQVVDHGQFFGHHQLDVGQPEVVFRRAAGQLFLDMAHGVVAEVAGQAAAETRHAGAQRHLEARLVLFDEVERIAFVLFDHGAVFHDLGAVAEGAQHGGGGQADEGKASEAFAADHRFQQEGVLAALLGLRQFQIQRERGFEVGERFRDQGDAVIALLCQRFEFEFGHVSLHAAGVQVCTAPAVGYQKTCRMRVRTRQQSSYGSALSLPGLPASPKPGLNRAGLGDIVFFDEKRVHDKVFV